MLSPNMAFMWRRKTGETNLLLVFLLKKASQSRANNKQGRSKAEPVTFARASER